MHKFVKTASFCNSSILTFTAAITLPHVAIKNIQVGSYVIPENSVVYVNLYSVHHDSEAWPEVNEFKPERFLDTGNRSDTTSDKRDDSDVTTNDNRDDSDVTGAATEEVNDGCSVVKNFDAFMPFMIGTCLKLNLFCSFKGVKCMCIVDSCIPDTLYPASIFFRTPHFTQLCN